MASTNPSTPNINVPIRIEPTDEYKIQEISYDGQEKYIPPPSMSENLSQLIQKIDFTQSIDELRQELEDAKTTAPNVADEDQDSSKKANRIALGSSWPFETMRTKLRLALTEICVLNDVLSIAKEKKYLVFDSVASSSSDQRPIVLMTAKKRAFQFAAQVLMDGCATIKSTQLQPQDQSSESEPWTPASERPVAGTGDAIFYEHLREMRRNYRLKRVGREIIGDLGYFRPPGSRFLPNSRFEVIKINPTMRIVHKQPLDVRVPAELEGRAHIQVSIIRNNEISLLDLSTSAMGRSYESNARESSWQQKLEAAQDVLYCKELFRHLANQAVQYQFVIPTTVTGDQIVLALFPDIKLYITLVHRTPNTRCSLDPSEAMQKLKKEHRPVFEHSLHQLLRDFYANMSKRLQGRDVPSEAGPMAIDKQMLFEVTRQESSLDKIVQQAQHLIMRHQTMDVIDKFAASIKDPLMIAHWFCLNNPTSSIVRVDIVSHNNEILGRSHMLIYIGTRQLRVITRDCKNLLLGYEPDELRHLLIWQSCLHQFIASDKLSKLLGWYTISLNYSVNVTRQEMSSSAFSLVICSSNCTHLISIKSGPQFGLAVDVAQFKDPVLAKSTYGSSPGSAELDTDGEFEFDCGDEWPATVRGSPNNEPSQHSAKLSKLAELVGPFREVDWEQLQGRDFLTKLELLMAALTELK